MMEHADYSECLRMIGNVRTVRSRSISENEALSGLAMWIVFSSHLFVGRERYAQQNDARVATRLPDVTHDGLSRGGVILALKDLAAFEGKAKRVFHFL
jgi:hypothetical protein